MKNDHKPLFSIDKENKKIHVERAFAAPLPTIWNAWTDSAILDQWWAPKPWKARTKIMDFKAGGQWLYAMVSPENEVHWSLVEFISVEPEKSFSSWDSFSDENGRQLPGMGRSQWINQFRETETGTIVTIEIRFEQLSDLEQMVAMGFKEGFTMGMENLDALLGI
ncbi:MAG: SRPBCC domain-containing protein [Bacteroidales bacterium]|nr:SRPBCC domain-containing protein [Bacteroidales bacterium]